MTLEIMSNIEQKSNDVVNSIVSLIYVTLHRVASTVNSELTLLYWNIGKQINEEVLKNGRADYGKTSILE